MLEPTDPNTLPITDRLAIPLAEFNFRYSRSSGPGGQHVNRTDTRVELLFDVAGSPSLTDDQRAHIRAGWPATSTTTGCCTCSRR